MYLLYIYIHIYIYIYLSIFMLPFQYINIENETNGKRKWQTSVCFLQTENGSLFSLVGK
jgi:hypothetical protein